MTERSERSGEFPWAVALTRCFFCGGRDKVVIPKVLTSKVAKVVESMDGKIIDMEPCKKCREMMEQGIILLTIDHARSPKDWEKKPRPDPHRTGGYFVVKEGAVRRIFNGQVLDFALKNRWVFVEHAAAKALGLFKYVWKEGEAN